MSDKEQQQAALQADKQRLIKEGELYRVSVLHSKMQVVHALHPEALLHGAVDHAIGAAQARLGNLLGGGNGGGGGGILGSINYKALMPYAITVGSFIARKRLIKPVLALTVVGGALAAYLLKRNRGVDPGI
ncbi:hypothetical protein [Massilia endophytica]|uniref:hypothetical protein n=1 Tax=Massilia endophytica TaxID=2899220 RepID=UPI001E63F067|nr:hypothetical protein [Massilia endophytica]UGQ47854.1 hypothetical protein LSQ66_05130 [Massilia endophytica]